MARVQIKAKSTASKIFQISIDDKVIVKVNHPYDNTLYVDLKNGVKHILVFYVEGKKGDTHSVEVVSPVNPPIKKGKLDAGGKNYGYITIDLSGGNLS
ncbi:MAG: hypothetical protein K0S33_3229 [Bacteroidetes bacterium]|jgi:hypothetical protein|nr:hypothetical protein [Bacteroidota bacterium]